MLTAWILIIQHRLGMYEFGLWNPFWHLVSWYFDSCHDITKELGSQLRSAHFVNEPLVWSHKFSALELKCWGWSPEDWCLGHYDRASLTSQSCSVLRRGSCCEGTNRAGDTIMTSRRGKGQGGVTLRGDAFLWVEEYLWFQRILRFKVQGSSICTHSAI